MDNADDAVIGVYAIGKIQLKTRGREKNE